MNIPSDISLYDPAERNRVELRYAAEAELMNEVAHGHSARAMELLSQFTNSVVEQRAPQPLRNFKNYLIILNTLLRKAVQQGGVHPLYIDRTSSAFGHRIEAVESLEEGERFIREMVHKYCLLVRNHAMRSYSPLIREVILRIDSDLAGDQSLSAHAKALNVNASYLSALFRRETGVPLSEAVARARVERALFFLNTTDMQIQAIALQCGIQDVNYFTRLFKRIMGKTPSEYRRQAQGKAGVNDPYPAVP